MQRYEPKVGGIENDEGPFAWMDESDRGDYVSYSEAQARISQLEAALKESIEWIKHAPEDAWGYANNDTSRWPIRDELAAKLLEALAEKQP